MATPAVIDGDPSGRSDDGIAIVGLGAVFPGAPSAEAFWANICNGVDSITDVPAQRWDPVFFDPDGKGADRFYCRRGGFVDDVASFDPLAFGIMPVAMESAEPDQLLALAAAAAALDDAGRIHERIAPERVAVILGRGGYLGDGVARLDQRVRTAQQLVEALRSLVPGIAEDQLQRVKAEFQAQLGPERPEGSIGLVPNLAASRIANRFDFQGAAYTVDAACASSLMAVDQAAEQLRSGRADLVLAGGVHHCHDLTLWSVFTQLRALSPSGGIRPFSEAADGILVGEGTGILALRRVADAQRDGDRIYAVIRGTGVASDGRAASLMSPRPEGQVLAVEAAWRASGLDPDSIGLIEAHGTATPLGDRSELETLRRVFGAARNGERRPGLGSVKSMIGHAMPAAGAAGLIKAALAVFHGELPPTLHVEEPNEAVAVSRFRLLAEREPWEGKGPRVAAVNAFGFGGINAHVVVAEAPGHRSRPMVGHSSALAPTVTPIGASPAAEELVLLAGRDAADLVEQLNQWSPGKRELRVPRQGPARLAIVAPDERRLKLARKVLERGTAFRGRNDVWFDPTGLLLGAGTVAFLLPGVEPVFEPRVEDVAEQFGLVWEGLGPTTATLQAQGRGIVAVGRLLADALERIGIRPDHIAGHSLGEWTGQIISGMIPADSIDDFLRGMRPESIEVSDVVFVALGCGVDVASELVAGLDHAYVSHDNCPHQSVICAPSEVIQLAVARARERKVLAQELPFRSGFHSPLFEPYVGAMARQFGAIELVPASTPLWSATTVGRYPDDPAGITELAGRHLVEPVRFRQLVEKLHGEGVRAFVQVGTGSLMGFVDDTLRDHDVLTVSANVAKQTGVGQLRRVAAALWASGLPVDFAPLGHRVDADPIGSGIGPAMPPLVGVAGRSLPLGSSLVRTFTPLDLGGGGAPSIPPDRASSPGSLLAEFQAAAREATAAARQVLDAAQQGRRSDPLTARRRVPATPSPSTKRASVIAPAAPTPDVTSRETVLELSVTAQPWWADHAFYPQPAGWPVLEDRFPLVPMTAIIEMLVEEAEALVPGSVAVSVEAIRAFKWLAVEPPTSVLARASIDAKATEAAAPDTTVVRTSIDGHARAVVRVAAGYSPSPPPSAVSVNGDIAMPVTVERLYAEGHLFHGPQYQGIRAFTSFGIDGVAGRLESQPAPGALLDNAGQLFGFWMASAVDRDRLVLPTSIDRISFYGPHPEPGTAVDCVVNCTQFGEQIVRADLELTVQGEVWCRIEGWEDRRFQSDDRLFFLLRNPTGHLLAEPQPGGWVLVREGWPDSASRDVVMRRFLGQAERADYADRNPNVQRTWLLGRIAAKDAVRNLLAEPDAPLLFPVEVRVANDPNGRPLIAVAADEDVRVSIAHTSGLGVAMAAIATDVGIDIELVEHRPGSFEAAGFTDAERLLMGDAASPDRHREVTRWWSAKEAAAKAAGTGMRGRPAEFEVVEVRGADLRVGHRWIATRTVTRPKPPAATTSAITSPTNKPETDDASPTETVAPSEEYIVAWTIAEPRDG